MAEVKELNDEEWEGLCNHCGDCCNLFNSGTACPVYDLKNKCCSNYEIRKKLNPNCTKLTPDNVLFLHENGVLSDRCNYVRHMKGQELVWDVEKADLKAFTEATTEFRMYYYATRNYEE